AFLQGATDDERFEAMKESAGLMTGGKLVEQKEIVLGQHHGREQLLEVEGQGQTRSRLFWVGDRLSAVRAERPPGVRGRQDGGGLVSVHQPGSCGRSCKPAASSPSGRPWMSCWAGTEGTP